MKKILAIFLLILAAVAGGCANASVNDGDEKEVDFTVVDKKDIPEGFMQSIEQAKDGEFTMTAGLDGYLYIAVGYGKQPTGGYSIRVDSLCEGKDDIRLHTTLIGPGSGEAVNKMETYPYIVLKIENTDKNIIFE